MRYIFCSSFLFCVCLCNIVLSVSCSLVVTCWDFLDLLYVMFSCVFVTFPYGILGQVLYLIISIPDLCLLTFISTKLLLMVCKILKLFQMGYMTFDSRIKGTYTYNLSSVHDANSSFIVVPRVFI